MKKRRDWGWLRGPKTQQEARANCDSEFARAKRRPSNLPTLYDDIDIAVNRDRSWKHKRKTQYRDRPRGKRHELVFDVGVYEWDFRKYCEKHNIPYEIEEIRERYTYSRELYKEVFRRRRRAIYDYNTRKYEMKFAWGSDWIPSGVWKEYIGRRVIGYRFIWWSDKDIGIEYILNRSPHI